MEWTLIGSYTNYDIYATFSDKIYKDDRNYLKFVFKNILNFNSFIFNGYLYTGYFDNEEVIIEITDLVRNVNISPFEYEFLDPDSVPIVFGEVELYSGFIQNSLTKINLPNFIRFDKSDLLTINIASSDGFEYRSGETWYPYPVNRLAVNDEITAIRQNGKIIPRIFADCDNKYIMIRWMNVNGDYKDWYFLQDKLNFSSDKSLQIDTGSSDYLVLKNKKISFSVIEKQADLSTQKYLSDLVISNDVKVLVDGIWHSVQIETSNVEISTRRKDLLFNVNFKHYDTI